MKEIVKLSATILLVICLVQTCNPNLSSKSEDVYIACIVSCIIVLTISYWIEPKTSK